MALLEGRRRSASVQAVQPGTVFALNSLDFRQILFRNPNFAKNILHVAQSRKFETDRA
jgi:CRP-like cAMP-binding protein